MHATVRTGHHVIGISGVDPERMKIAVYRLDPIIDKRLPPILRVRHPGPRGPDPLVVRRVNPNLAVVHRTRIRVTHARP